MSSLIQRATSRWAPALAALALLLGSGPAADGQEPYTPLVPRGEVRLGVLGAYAAHSEIFEIGGLGGGPHRLADRFGGPVGSGIFPFLALHDAAVGAALGDEHAVEGGHAASLGMLSSVLEESAVRVPLALDAGVFDWLTVGATLPLVLNDTEFAAGFWADADNANTGFSPGVDDPGAVSAFMTDLRGSIGAFDAVRGQACANDPRSAACIDATALVDDARAFQNALSALYAGAFAPLGSSAAGRALAQRLAGFADAFEAAGVTDLPGAMPLAERHLSRADVEALATDPAFGIGAAHSFESWRAPWRIGDVALRADARVHETGSLSVGAGATVRLPTGVQDDPDNFVDAGSGTGQLDAEARAWFRGSASDRLGLWGDVRYGVRMQGTTVRRVAAPDVAFAPAASKVTLNWNPGDYLSVELSPWYRIADQLSAVAGFRYFRKAEDAFSIAVAPVTEVEGDAGAGRQAQTAQPLDPAVLVPGTGGSVGTALLGLVYSRTGDGQSGRGQSVEGRTGEAGGEGRPGAEGAVGAEGAMGAEGAGADGAMGAEGAGAEGAMGAEGPGAGDAMGAEVTSEAGALRPLEIRVIYRRAVVGSGSMPVARSLEVGFRLFRKIW